ncbi:MAG TPA: cytochrome C, partial [Myxococcales bacterium]|nr:cytochrome C [Myxococcales bacterium]
MPAPVAGAATAVRGTLVFKASTAGQIVPCGCSPDQRGGLPRAAAELKKLRSESPGLAYVE